MLQIFVRNGTLDATAVNVLIEGPSAQDPGSMGPLTDWLPEALWARVKALEQVKPKLGKLGDDMQNMSAQWQKWFDLEKPDMVPCPGAYKDVEPLYLLLILRALRPDRLTTALTSFISDLLGPDYVMQQAFDMGATFAESGPTVPIFFVLFPGVDPTVWVEGLGQELGFSGENGKFRNISMGQGQEPVAEASLKEFARDGGWLMLQNLHLMQSWVQVLERQLEILSESAHKDFRCFISAEPPSLSYMKNMPESLMQTCIKVANEAPADLQSNLRRAWASFSQERINQSNKKDKYQACLFTMCFYHAIVQGRRRFGQQGFSKRYSFNQGDLRACTDILMNYLNRNPDVPWDDIKYIFGEIMYGGHITDAWDRRTNNTYLRSFLAPGILDGMELCEGFKVPDMTQMDFASVAKYINTELPKEAPPMFGLHANAEIGYLTTTAETLFRTILVLEGASGGGSGGGGGAAAAVKDPVRERLEDLLERLPEDFVMIDIQMKSEALLKEAFRAPYVLVAMQECLRMNVLLQRIRTSLIELQKGLDGQLNMSDAMEDLRVALSINEVPGRNVFSKTNWEKVAWPSKKTLPSWFMELLRRVEQLDRWTDEMERPVSLWLPGLFNPMAFLTAIMQITARTTKEPLDKMVLETHVTMMTTPDKVSSYPAAGAYIHGIFIEGARWPDLDEAGDPFVVPDTEDNVMCAGALADGRLKELLPMMPVMYVRAVEVQPQWDPTEVGYMRQSEVIFDCPVYFTTFRGPTYIFLATMPTQDGVRKWVLAGVALILQEDD